MDTLTKKQKADLETVRYFIPKSIKHVPILESDVAKFFENSEKGLHEEDTKLSHFDDGFNVLLVGKSRRGLHMRMWEETILEGSVPYCVLLEGLPRSVVDFMKKEMFKGVDAERIELCYQSLNGNA